jgi:outer membrane protein W
MRIVTIFVLMFVLSASVFSQAGLVNFNYQISYPTGETSNYIDKVSFRGVGLEWRKGIDKNIQAGISLNWNVFNQVVNETAEIEDGHVTGTQNRTINSFPLLATGHYYFGKRKETRPYFGLGLGAYLIKERLGIGVYTIEESNWHFGVAPEVGVQIPMGYDAMLMIFARYNHAFEANGSEHSYLGLHIAIATEVF